MRTELFYKEKTMTKARTKQRIVQYPFERLYVSPFTKKRGFDERHLKYKLVPMEQERQLTGIKLLDAVVDMLINGVEPRCAASKFGITREKLSTSVYALTGLTLVGLRKHWNMQLANDLLRYTDLPLREVMQRCGYTSMPTFSRTVSQWWSSSPQAIRIGARRRGDIGKYAL